ncbi:Zinc finger CCHC domain-containing protein 7 [Amphibalanus amphitrite]|uniref:Zinc finger CCHC domain-containing protein 7 n=1 Tax=Amphibalanus amphitrite TaxID=1232801 RepID=A0A6A4WSP8_AMPAM|nr:Zinc finger CCHC domain-containing protein 7 [Amphibalanus amphitrite]KAF0310217.1 Zinc finger CCHC domain-containing protein 7 [Amphibalanus amphitrite]
MLYAQIHYAAPDAATGAVEALPAPSQRVPEEPGPSKTSGPGAAAPADLANGLGHADPPGEGRAEGTTPGAAPAAGTPAPVVRGQSPGTAETPGTGGVGRRPAGHSSAGAAITSRPADGPAQPTGAADRAAAGAPGRASVTLGDSVQLAHPPASRPAKRPRLSSSSSDDAETKTAALAASERRRQAQAGPARPLVTVHGSSSDSELSVDDGVREVSARPAPALVTLDGSTSSSEPEVVPPAGDSRPPPARPRPRTSSDLSSSAEDSDGAAGLPLDCNIQMNVRGAAVEQRPGRRPEQVAAQEPALPEPAYRRALSSVSLAESERRLLEPLCRAPVCHKWSARQREGYATPRHYGPSEVHGLQETMSDRGWDVPVEYRQRPAAARPAAARYYSNLAKNRCRRCDEVGHVMAACPRPPTCYLCGGSGHSAEGRCPNLFCYMCGRPDHPSSRCARRVRPVFCALCQASGHTSDECTDRWRRLHATTRPGPALRPPPALEKRPARRLYCWQCGLRGHPGHQCGDEVGNVTPTPDTMQCGDERYTIRASLSQRVVSYTETARACRQVSGLVATPAQMDAVFAPKRRRRIERETGAELTYEQLGDHSWLINISGDVSAARAAHQLVQTLLQGQRLPRPRPSSAPSSPARGESPAGAASAPASPRPRRRQRAAAARRSAPAEVLEVELHSGSEDGRSPAEVSEVPLTVTLESDDEPGSELSALTAAGRSWDLSLLDREDREHAQSAARTPKLSRKQRKKQRASQWKGTAGVADRAAAAGAKTRRKRNRDRLRAGGGAGAGLSR